MVAPILGSITAIICWLTSTKALEGTISIATTSQILPLVIGNATSLICGILYSVLCTFIFGADDFDWERFKTEIKVVDDRDVKGLTAEQLAQQQKRAHLAPEEKKALKRGKKLGILYSVVCLPKNGQEPTQSNEPFGKSRCSLSSLSFYGRSPCWARNMFSPATSFEDGSW